MAHETIRSAVAHPQKHRLLLALLFVAAPIAALFWQMRAASAPLSSCPTTSTEAQLCTLLQGEPTARMAISYDQIDNLRAFYAARKFQPAWGGSDLSLQQARAARTDLAGAGKDGLDPAEYRTDERTPWSPQADILLTEAVLRYTRDLRSGRVALVNRGGDVSLPSPRFNAVQELNAALTKGQVVQFLDDQRPSVPQYARLAGALAQYKSIAAHGGWHALPPLPKGGAAGDPAYMDAVQVRLTEERLISAASSDPLSSAERLSAAVSHYQQTHGLRVDGKVGKETLEALNVSVAQRADTIAANMERWRWMPRPIEARYIMVNVPANTLEVVDRGKVILSSRVVAGRPRDPSPILRAEVRGIVINPPWNVPNKIAQREILPKVRRDPQYLAKNDMIVKDNGQIQQLAGPKSALGTIKLDMPNPFAVYLHDTPTRNAFALDKRHLSHGCVRVQAILPLASFVLAGDPVSGKSEVEQAVAAGRTQSIPVAAPVPVYFAYWTSFVDSDGTVEFRPDIYGRDERLLAVLHRGTPVRVTRLAGGCPIG
jgi:murein L,D-transpeptidase YcbB/YkuD